MATSPNKITENLGKTNPSEGLRSQIGDVTHKVQDITDDASEYATRFYDTATKWLEENRSTAITTVAVFAAVGIAAYFIGRNYTSSAKEMLKTDRAA